MNSINKVNLSQVKKCNQYWIEMDSIEGGRLCDQCDKTIIDFRSSSHKEIAEAHVFASERVCGIYRKGQLDSSIRQYKKFSLSKVKGIYIGVMGLMTSFSGLAGEAQKNFKATSHCVPVASDRETKIIIPRKSEVQTFTDSIYVSGKLTDGNEPLIFVSIHIEGTRIGTVTDMNGNYSLNVTNAIDTCNSITLIYKYVGFGQKNITIPKSAIVGNIVQDVQLKSDNNFMAFGVSYKRPFHRNFWSKIKRAFRR